ncbi:phage head-tail joining family protein [Bacteroides fragilis str. 20793-3]|nr:phage head-tail joining family protein [Bacteroides fragilis str. 20793-3]
MVRYSRDISEKMRIVYEGRKYKIAFIHPDRKAQSITIEAELINE